jgi:hypothetical protein
VGVKSEQQQGSMMMTTATATTFQIHANYDNSGRPALFVAHRDFATVEDARRFAADMPKSIRAKVSHLSGCGDSHGTLSVRANFTADAANRGKNESGVSRYFRLMRWLADNGHTAEWVSVYQNAYETAIDFEQAITAA